MADGRPLVIPPKPDNAPYRLSHGQFEELQRFEDGHGRYIFRSPSKSLTVNGLLGRVPNSGETRSSSAWQITTKGRESLAVYRVKWGIQP